MNTSAKPAYPRLSRRSALAGSIALAAGSRLTSRGAAAQNAPPASGKITTKRNIEFGETDGQKLLLDAYLPPARELPRPAVALFHPAGMTDGDRTWMAEPANALAAAGYAAFSIEYRHFLPSMSRNLWPAQLDDSQRAVRWIRANAAAYNVDPERVAAYGHSSGGQLAAFLGTRDTRDNSDATLAGFSSRVSCVVDLAGQTDLTIPYTDPGMNDTTAALLGGTADAPADAAAYRDFSPIAFVDATSSPFLILQGGADDVREHSRRMEAALVAAGVEVVYGEFPGLDHFAWDWAHAGTWTLAFFGHHLEPDR